MILPTRNGYTILELVVVILVIGVLAAIATARMISPSANLPSVAGMIAADIRELQALAMSQGSKIKIKFSRDGYRVFQGKTEIRNTRFPVDISSLHARIDKARKVIFNTFGEPGKKSAKPIVIRSTDGRDKIFITIERYTGFVSIDNNAMVGSLIFNEIGI